MLFPGGNDRNIQIVTEEAQIFRQIPVFEKIQDKVRLYRFRQVQGRIIQNRRQGAVNINGFNREPTLPEFFDAFDFGLARTLLLKHNNLLHGLKS